MSHNKQNKDDILHTPNEISQLPADIPCLPATWYDQLQDPTDPPQRELLRAIVLTLNEDSDNLGDKPSNDDAVIKSFPSGEDLGEASEAFESPEASASK